MTVRWILLGSPAVERDGASQALPFERRTQLLAYLALKRDWIGRAELAALLWPEQEPKLAFTNLRKTLFRLQGSPWAEGIEAHGNALRFLPATDVLDFERALAAQRFADAAALRRGELLAGFDGSGEAWSEWLRFERDRTRAAWRGALLEHLAGDIDPVLGAELSSRLIEADPLDEAAVGAHMSWLSRSGQGARARQVYREYGERLRRELGLDPGSELAALHQSLGASATTSIGATDTATAARTGAAEATSARSAAAVDAFIGRSIELRRIAELLARPDCRLVTIVGPGGAGKTTLAQRALDQAGGSETAFVALEGISTATALAHQVARALEVKLASGDALDQVIAAIAARRMLLVLDNCEDIAHDAAVAARLLDGCPGVKLIATSRIRLGLAGEWLLTLEGLPCPEVEDFDRIEAFDAARLFVRTAQRVAPELVPAREAAAIVDICRQVEGLPLALELAAGWTRVLTCSAIAHELREGTELLSSIDPSQPPRHASLDIVFEQSLRLLTTGEREALARLSVLRGSFSPETARVVAAASLPVLGALADKSLLRKEENGRLSLHPLVRQMAGLRLAGDARAEAERAHALHFHRAMADRRRALESADARALSAMDADFENCRVAWQWALDQRNVDLVARSVLPMLHYCDLRDRHDEGAALLNSALEPDADWAGPALEALLLAAAAHLQYRRDRYVEAQSMAARALGIARRARQPATQALALQVQGACELRRGRHAAAREHFAEGHARAQAAGDPRKAGVMRHNQALVENALGRTDEAVHLSFEALACYREAGDVAGEALCLNNLGMLYMTRNDVASAVVEFDAALALCDRHGFAGTRGLVLANLTEVAMKRRDLATAARHVASGLEIAESTRNRSLGAWLRIQRSRLAAEAGDLESARSELAAAMDLALSMDRPALQLDGVCVLAEVLERQGDRDCAAAVLRFAAEHPSLGIPDREALRAQLHARGNAEVRLPSEVDLRGLTHRIVVEAKSAYASLVAVVRAP